MIHMRVANSWRDTSAQSGNCSEHIFIRAYCILYRSSLETTHN